MDGAVLRGHGAPQLTDYWPAEKNRHEAAATPVPCAARQGSGAYIFCEGNRDAPGLCRTVLGGSPLWPSAYDTNV